MVAILEAELKLMSYELLVLVLLFFSILDFTLKAYKNDFLKSNVKKWLFEHPNKKYEYPLKFCSNWFNWLGWVIILSTITYIASKTSDPIIWFIFLATYVLLFIYFYIFFFKYARWLTLFDKNAIITGHPPIRIILDVTSMSFSFSLGIHMLINHIVSILLEINIK
jgi:hypothetical protein